jgi:ketosteroid isomerase-like protein
VRRNTALIPLALTVLVLAGCGGGSDQTAAVRATVVAYGNAVAAKDYATICNRLLAPNLLAPMASINLPCKTALARALGSVKKPTMTVGTVKVAGQSALASVHTTAANQRPADTTFGLVKVAGGWRIASLAAAVTTPPAVGTTRPAVGTTRPAVGTTTK